MFLILRKNHEKNTIDIIKKILIKYDFDIFENENIYILHKNLLLKKLPNDQFILFEKLFSKQTFLDVPNRILESVLSLDEFMASFYGSYIWIDCSKNSLNIYRDISGKIPVFYKKTSNSNIFFSDIFLCEDFTETPTKFNFNYFQEFVLRGNFLSVETPFENINEVLPGWGINYAHEKEIQNPLWLKKIISSDPIPKVQLEQKLLGSLIGVVSNQINDLENVVVDFSGGVDSTGLLLLINSIKHKDQNVIAAHYYFPKIISSCELTFVQEVIDDIKIPLVTIEYSERDLPFTPRATPLKKLNYASTLHIYGKNEETIDEYFAFNNKAFIRGYGGDHIFCCPPISNALIDRVYRFNPFKTFELFKDFSVYHGVSLLRVCSFVLKSILTPKKQQRINSNLIKDFDVTQPLSCELDLSVLPGKREHISQLLDALADIRYNIRGTSPIIYPLMQEPIIELALKFRTFDLFEDGTDRAPYRKVMMDNFGIYESLKRKNKGETSGIIFQGLLNNKKTVEDYLFNGVISQSQLVDMNYLRKLFQDSLNGGLINNELNEVMNLWNIEEFYRSWR